MMFVGHHLSPSGAQLGSGIPFGGTRAQRRMSRFLCRTSQTWTGRLHGLSLSASPPGRAGRKEKSLATRLSPKRIRTRMHKDTRMKFMICNTQACSVPINFKRLYLSYVLATFQHTRYEERSPGYELGGRSLLLHCEM